MKKQNNGITLIALVITIIILLILAGVALSIVFNGGMIEKSQNAVDKYGDASRHEGDELSSIDQKIGDYFSQREEKKVLDSIFSNNWSVGKTDTGYIAADYDNDKLYTLDAQGNIVSEEELVYADEGLFTFDESTGTITGRNWSNWSLTVPKIFAIPKTINNVRVTGVSSYVISNFNDIDICIYPVGFTSADGCGSAHTLAIPTSVTTLSFSGSNKLKNILIPSGVTSISGSAFRGCTGLESLVVESGNIKYDSRDNCNAIIETSTNKIVVGTKNTIIPQSVESIGNSSFEGCTELININIPNGVTSIENNAFQNCTGLTSVTISNGVTSIGNNAFKNCTGLTSVTIPNSVTRIKDNVFKNCISLTGVKIPNSVTSIGSNVFDGCTGLESLVVESGNTKYDSRDNCNGIIITSTNTLVAGCKNTVIPQSVTAIGEYAFNGCTGLTSVAIPNSVTSIGSNVFSGCTGLTSVTISSGVTSIGYMMFEKCTGLTSITIPNNVNFIDARAFMGCTGLTSVTIPDSVTSIDMFAFSGCTGLTSVTIPGSVTSIGSAAFTSLASNSTIYVESDAVKTLLNGKYTTSKTTVVVDPSKF